MRFTVSCVATILAFTSSVASAPLEASAALQDWVVTIVNTYGSYTLDQPGPIYPWDTIIANVTDPNALHVGSGAIAPAGSQGINCKAQYLNRGDMTNSLAGRIWPCEEIDNGYWTMEVVDPTDWNGFIYYAFQLKFTHFAERYDLGNFSASYEATGAFSVNGNLAGTCDGFPNCDFGLNTPSMLITPKKV